MRAILLILLSCNAFADEQPLQSMPYTPSLDLSAMDQKADPCGDFYQYACGGWEKKNPIPPDQASWSVYGKLDDETEHYLWGVLQAAAKAPKNPLEKQIGDYFAACTDEAGAEAAGVKPIQVELDRVRAMKSLDELPPLLAHWHLAFAPVLFGFSSSQDFGNAAEEIAFAYAGGLGLPDRDYYTKTDAKSVEIRKKYLEHVALMLSLIGDKTAEAEKILALETELAKASLTRVEKRSPKNLHHALDRKQLQALSPAFSWDRYLSAIGLSDVKVVNVTEPAFYKEMQQRLAKTPLATWKAYLRWQLVRDAAPYLSKKFAVANFDFYRKYLRGVPAEQPRWKRCVQWIDRDLGEALGKVYVDRLFGPEVKKRTLDMTVEIERAMAEELKALPWMGAETKAKASEKLKSIVNKIGYPDKWRDYSSIVVKRDDFFGDFERANEFEARRQLAKIGKPLDRGEWQMTPPTVNAYYDPQMNDINFPAGVLQPPLFDFKLDDAPNYGNTGATIGHELIHGFDDEGRQFDARGNLTDWWSPADDKQFLERAQCVVDEYAQFVVVDDIKINSKLTLGEDLADLGGTVLAYQAWKRVTQGKKLPKADGFSPDQRFFIGMAQWACNNERDENKRLNAITNPHSPGKYRINGVVANMPEFGQAFSCKAGAPMVRKNQCRVW